MEGMLGCREYIWVWDGEGGEAQKENYDNEYFKYHWQGGKAFNMRGINIDFPVGVL